MSGNRTFVWVAAALGAVAMAAVEARAGYDIEVMVTYPGIGVCRTTAGIQWPVPAEPGEAWPIFVKLTYLKIDANGKRVPHEQPKVIKTSMLRDQGTCEFTQVDASPVEPGASYVAVVEFFGLDPDKKLVLLKQAEKPFKGPRAD